MTVAEDLASRESLTDLPSKFQVYDVDEVKIRPFTAGEVRKLGAALDGRSGALRDELMDIVDGTISMNAADLTRGDFWYVLAWLRINTFRNAPLNFKWDCPKGHSNITPLVLTELELIELEEFHEPAYLKLGSGEEIPLRLPRLGDESAAVKYLKSMNANGQWTEEEKDLVEAACIVLDGASLHQRVEFLKGIEDTPTGAEDLFMLDNFQLTYQHGLPKTLSAACSSCEYETEVPIPFRFQDILPYGSYGDHIRSSVRFGEAPTGDKDE